MGDPKKQRKKYSKPPHPWEGERIKKEHELLKEYGLVKKKEIWKMESVLRKFKSKAKLLIAGKGKQADAEREQLLNKLLRLSLIKDKTKIENVLALELKDILNRRLQTLLCKRGLAKTPKQARQFIVHGHVLIGDKIINSPSYLVLGDEEDKIRFDTRSNLNNPEHPERKVNEKG